MALLRAPAPRPPHEFSELIEAAGSASSVLAVNRSTPGSQTQLPLPPPDGDDLLTAAADDLERWRQEGIRVLTVLDPAYPDNLRAVHDRPPLIFVRGELTEADTKSVAVIGSRKASPEGRYRAREMAAHLSEAGYTIVSGLALGIDAAAHEAALSAPGGRTIAVLGNGCNHAYPPQNASLQQRISRQGALVSQFWPDQPPTRTTFPLRNATMSGLALATVIVEAGLASGARIQARRALAHGRRIFLCTPVLSQPWARELSERPGVAVVDRPAEVRQALDELSEQQT